MSRTSSRPETFSKPDTTSRTNGKQVFTTGEAARLCNLSQQTIIRCFDSGRLRGYHVPGSKTRRIPRADLIRFMRSHQMPLDALGESEMAILMVENEAETVELMRELVASLGGYVLHVAQSAYEAGVMTVQVDPQVVVMNLRMPDFDAAAACRSVRTEFTDAGATVILMANKFRVEELEAFRALGVTGFVRKPIKFEEMSMALRGAATA